MNITQIQTELGNYFRVNSKEVQAMVYGAMSPIFDNCRTITRVKGKFPAIHSVTNDLVQGFTTTWNEVGSTKFRVNELVAYHQKVNYPLIPDELEGSWLAELNNGGDQGTSLEDRSISRYIMQNELTPKVRENIADLVINGVYNAGALGTYGNSMNGILKILINGVADAENSMFKIPLDTLTDSNMVEMVTTFEQRVPKKLRKFIDRIFMSTANAQRYQLDYENTFGSLNLNNGAKLKTRLNGWNIIGIDEMSGSDTIFCTPNQNRVKLIDSLDNPPMVTDVQLLDYKIKVFMEWWLGVGFFTNQLVCVSVTNGSGSGLTTDMSVYYSNE